MRVQHSTYCLSIEAQILANHIFGFIIYVQLPTLATSCFITVATATGSVPTNSTWISIVWVRVITSKVRNYVSSQFSFLSFGLLFGCSSEDEPFVHFIICQHFTDISLSPPCFSSSILWSELKALSSTLIDVSLVPLVRVPTALIWMSGDQEPGGGVLGLAKMEQVSHSILQWG